MNRQTLVDFAMPTVPAGCSITSATLSFTMDSGTSGRTLEAYRAATTWNENTTTWITKPDPAGTAASTLSASAGVISAAVKDQVQAIYPTSPFGFVVKDSVENAGTAAEQAILSRTGGTGPKLALVFG